MTSRSADATPHRAPSPFSAQRMQTLAFDLLAAELPDMAVGVRVTRQGRETLRTRPLQTESATSRPADQLIGFETPSSWGVFGVVVHGRTRLITSTNDVGAGRSDHGVTAHDRRSSRVVHLVNRVGTSCTVVAGSEGDAQTFVSEHPVVGLVGDACRLAMRLPTAPPSNALEHWSTAIWFDRILAMLLDDPRRPRPQWPRLVALHPCANHLPASIAPEDLPDAVACLLRPGWEHLRRSVVDGDAAEPLAREAAAAMACDSHAAWLDSGAFARCCEASLPGVEVLFETISEVGGTRVAAVLAVASGLAR